MQDAVIDQKPNTTDVFLKESDFPVGEPIQILDGENTYFSTIRGVKFKKYVVIENPVEQDAPVVFEEKYPLSFRFLHSGKIHSFTSKVEKRFEKEGLFLIEYPLKCQRINLRKNERVKLLLPTTVITDRGKSHFQGTILDLSLSGALLGVDLIDGIGIEKFRVGEKIRISFMLPTLDSVVIINVDVKKCRRMGHKTLVGISFDELEKGLMRALEKFYSQFVTYQYKREPLLTIGHKVTVEIEGKSADGRAMGWLKGKKNLLLLEIPEDAEIGTEMTPGAKVLMQYKTRGSIFVVNGHVRAYLKETSLWEIEFDENIFSETIRHDERYNCMMPLTVTDKIGSSSLGKGMVLDISINGAKMVSVKPFPPTPDNMVFVNFPLPKGGEMKAVHVEIMRTEKTADNYIYAGRFDDLQEENRMKLQSFFSFHKEWDAVQSLS